MRALVTGIFFASGVSALVFETLWFHQAGLALGNSVWASSLVLAAFMAGLALGNAWAARRGDRLDRPLRAYALAEAVIAGTGVALVYALPLLGGWLAPALRPLMEHSWLLNPLRLSVAFAALLLPSTAMGVTLPLLTRALTGAPARFGAVLGQLYGWNTLGAVAGVVAAEGLLVGALGVRASALAAGALNAVAAALAAVLARRIPAIPPRAAATPPAWLPPSGRRFLLAAFLAGFALLALEVVWFRFLSLFVESRSVSFALLLGVVLTGISLGGMAAGRVLAHAPSAHRHLGLLAFAAGTLCMASYAAFPVLAGPQLAAALQSPAAILRVGAPLVLPTALVSGAIFTFLGAALREKRGFDAETTGALTFANTLGAALGSLAGGFALLPGVGMEGSLFLLSLLYGAIGTLLVGAAGPARRAAWAGAFALVSLAALFPFGALESRHLRVPIDAMTNPRDRILGVREGLLETIVYVEHRELGQPAYQRMITNAYSMSANDWYARRYMDLYVTWPVALHPRLERALLISYGVGTTAKALTETASLVSIDVVDISRDVLEMSAHVFEANEHPLSDSRVRVHVEDGRHFLLTTDRRFDLITGEPPPPQMAGVVNLYTREYFALLRERLAEGGMVTYWLPTHSLSERASRSVLRAFCEAFEDCSLWHAAGANLMMVGTRGARGPVSEAHFARQWRDPDAANELEAIGLERPEQLGALFVGGADYLATLTRDVPPLVDDHPKRITARPTHPGAEASFARSWTDVDAARERYRNSALVRRLWPASTREATLAYFEPQRVIQRVLLRQQPLTGQRLGDVHWMLTQTSLSAPVIWLLGSDGDKQRIVRAAPAPRRAHPQYRLHEGIRLLSQRRFAEAAEALGSAESLPQLAARAVPLKVYALALLGERERAEQVAREHPGLLHGTGDAPADFAWMRDALGIDPKHPLVARSLP